MRRIAFFLALMIATAWSRPGSAQEPPAGGPKLFVYVGIYTGGEGKGIHLLEMDPESGIATPKGMVGESTNPSFLAIHPSRKFLYAANEVGKYEGQDTGSVSSFAIDPASGKLTMLNRVASGGADPCFVTVDATGRNLLVANYSGGSVAVLPIGTEGALGEAHSVLKHRGSSVNKDRQAGPHAHSINLDAANRLAVAADLGLDKLLLYDFDADRGLLKPHVPADAALAPGAGPRHFAFHPDGRHAYAINELDSTITVFDFDATRGAFARLQTITTRAPGADKPGNSTAEVVVHPSGRFVYGSNRGDDALAIYSVEPGSGKLTYVGSQATGGKTPRNFAIDPNGRFLLAANQDSGTVVVFRINPESGRLAQVGAPLAVPKPVCIRFVPAGG